mmetsp:Transcript_3421/g.4795  ORF Transcript_3421/g.4795 Transcript_3421/m.4795 type:complete len:209 (-) Transcript_3421:419-1045(-)
MTTTVAQAASRVNNKYGIFMVLLCVYTLGLSFSRPLAVRFAKWMRWKLRNADNYKKMTKYSAPLIGLPLFVAIWDQTPTIQGWHWWFSGICLLLLSITFHGELVRNNLLLRLIQRCDQTFAAYHFAYHLWLALCVGSVLGLIFLSLVVGFYFIAWIEAYTHVGVHICGTLAGLAILVAQMQLHASVSHVPFVLAGTSEEVFRTEISDL